LHLQFCSCILQVKFPPPLPSFLWRRTRRFILLWYAKKMRVSELYESQVRKLKRLHRNGACKTELKREAVHLGELKRLLRHVRSKTRPQYNQTPASYSPVRTEYPAHMNLPIDDEGFIVSFSLSPDSTEVSAVQFYQKFGFVIFRDILEPEECNASQCEIWDALEQQYPGLHRSSIPSLSVLTSQTYGLSSAPAVFTPQMLRNRCNPKLVKVMRLLLGDNDILMSHDRWCFYRPTKSLGMCETAVDMPEWKTAASLHLDLNPWTFIEDKVNVQVQNLYYDNLRDFSKEMNSVNEVTGPHLQGVLALTDSMENDGGTVLVPGFHHIFSSWVKSLGDMKNFAQHSDPRRNRLVWRGGGSGSFKFCDSDPIHHLKQRITVRAGSLLLWDQRLVHGSVPNNSNRFRMAQFIRPFRRKTYDSMRLERRSKVVTAHLESAGKNFISSLTTDDKRVLGLHGYLDN